MKLFTSSFCAIKSGVGLGFPVRGISPSCSDNGILSDFHTIEFTLWNRKILNMSNAFTFLNLQKLKKDMLVLRLFTLGRKKTHSSNFLLQQQQNMKMQIFSTFFSRLKVDVARSQIRTFL